MQNKETRVPVTREEKSGGALAMSSWGSLRGLRREIDQLFDDFAHGLWRHPFGGSSFDIERFGSSAPAWMATPAVDVIEKADAYEITAEVPGMDDKGVEVKVVNGALVIRGEKQEEKEEKERDYYLHERRFGSFERRFPLPEYVDADKIAASMKNGVLTVTVPKTPEAQRPEKKIEIKSAA